MPASNVLAEPDPCTNKAFIVSRFTGKVTASWSALILSQHSSALTANFALFTDRVTVLFGFGSSTSLPSNLARIMFDNVIPAERAIACHFSNSSAVHLTRIIAMLL